VKRLEGKVALVTGGASGLGRAIAQRLASEGATVVISDIQSALGDATANEAGLHFMQQDVSDEAQWKKIVASIEHQFGRLNILVNNAGILGPPQAGTPENTTLDTWRRIFAVNVEGVFMGCQTAIAAMVRAGGGAIVNLSSMGSRLATPRATAYGASKAAVRHLTRSVAQHCAQKRFNIRCNSVHPGTVRTPLLDKAMREAAEARGVPFETIVAEYESRVPLGGLTKPEDVAAAVAFLVSDDARHITGSALYVDGGTINCNTYRP
jgi:3(or 17)beta-hydroxysteroid dehydrogenase